MPIDRNPRRQLRLHARSLLLLAAITLLTGGEGVAGASPAQDPTIAPATTLSADGRTVSSATASLSASAVHGLSSGQAVTVSGSGYDVSKGVYVSLCVLPPANQAPSPCGGGQDRSGTSSASTWISSDPPSYAEGLTQPYGPGGSFTVTLAVSPQINDALDCFAKRCVIATRADHTRGSDRSQDLFLPVTFAAAPPTTSPVEVAPSPPTEPVPAPTTTVAQPVTTTSTLAEVRSTTSTTSSTDGFVEPADGEDGDVQDVALAASEAEDDGDGAGAGLVVVGAVLVLAVGGAVAWTLQGRRSGTSTAS